VKVEVMRVAGEELETAAELLGCFLRGGELPRGFLELLARHVDAGTFEVFVARLGEAAGVATVSYRPAAATGGEFAAIEDLYVRPEYRGLGAGKALVRAVEERCVERSISYIEVQVSGDAGGFYAGIGYGPEGGVRVLSRSLLLGG
jgi:GNAT superfamily N-acetyltransferase